MSEAGKQIKRVALELGGNAPYIIFADADLDQAVDDLIALKCRNSGQICVTANRILIEKGVHQAFLTKLLERIAGERVGDGRDPASSMGPLIHPEAADKVRSLITEALSSGARLLFQGRVPEGAAFYPPTVLDAVTPDMRIAREEIFGPVFSILTFASEGEALEQANDTSYGLASFVYTNNMARAQRFADGLETGVVGINDPRPIIPGAPFGGVKQSGIGREGGTEGLLEYMDSRLIGIRYSAQ